MTAFERRVVDELATAGVRGLRPDALAARLFPRHVGLGARTGIVVAAIRRLRAAGVVTRGRGSYAKTSCTRWRLAKGSA